MIVTWVLAVGAESPTLRTDMLEVALDAGTGRMVGLQAAGGGRPFLANEPGTGGGLWDVRLEGKDTAVLSPEEAGDFSWRSAPGQLELIWGSFGLPDAPDLQVTARIYSGDDGLTFWSMAIEGPGLFRVAEVRFPRLVSIAELPGETLAIPVWMGEKTDRIRALLNPPGGAPGRMQWEYPGPLSLQCLALHAQAGPGLYLDCRDPEARRKAFVCFGGPSDALGLEVLHLPEWTPPGASYHLPYPVTLGMLEGDWHDAAMCYRSWAVAQEWARESRFRRGLVPKWLTETGLWIWNRGRSENVLGPAAVLQQQAGVPVHVFWHWWHGCAYDAGFPDYLPPREGADPFRAAVAAASAQGIHALVYMNQRLWCLDTPSWETEDAPRYAVKLADGRPRMEVYNTFTQTRCAPMCLGTSFWRNKYAALAEGTVGGLGVAGIYMDQACLSLPCYDPGHGHPLGDGTWWVAGFRELAADIRRRCGPDTDVALAGEGCGESWLPYLDLMLSLQVSKERYAGPNQWEPIPFFHAVYHDYGLYYGNYSSLTRPPYDDLWPPEFAPASPLELLDRKFVLQFRLEQARAFVWGQQPTLANFLPAHLEERAEEMAYVLQLARLRTRALPYLRDGTWLRPPRLNVPEELLDMSRLSIYAGQHGGLQEFQQSHPTVIASAWQAPEGGIAVVAANITDTGITFPLTLDGTRYPIAPVGSLRALSAEADYDLGSYEGGYVSLEVSLPPAEARIFLFPGR